MLLATLLLIIIILPQNVASPDWESYNLRGNDGNRLIERIYTGYESRGNGEETVEYACDSKTAPRNWFIYCGGRLLEAVNHHRLFVNESKEFVYRPLRHSAKRTLYAFTQLFPSSLPVEKINRTALGQFVSKHFYSRGEKGWDDLEVVKPRDWLPNPPAILAIKNATMREWALELHSLWLRLARRVSKRVKQKPGRHSLVYLPKSFIVPSERRFREIYYWDSYWTIKGLLVSGMFDTARDILENFLYLIDTYGFVPNGGRVYHLRRSQPPFLALMVNDYFEATNDTAFLRRALPRLSTEMRFWLRVRRVEVMVPGWNKTLPIFRYRADSNQPWPEDYVNQKTLAEVLPTEEEKRRFYRELATDAESGLDHSSRWMRTKTPKARSLRSDETAQWSLLSLETTNILAMDFYALLCGNMALLSKFYWIVGDKERAEDARGDFLRMAFLHRTLFWRDGESGNSRNSRASPAGWFDYNIRTANHSNLNFYASAIAPLFTGCFDHLADRHRILRAFAHWESLGLFSPNSSANPLFPWGLPASTVRSGQQWDAPNGWAPANHMFIVGLQRAGNAIGRRDGERLKSAARLLAQRWLAGNYAVYRSTGYMWERYDVSAEGGPRPGGGGEFHPEPGFGWTNGVVLSLLKDEQLWTVALES